MTHDETIKRRTFMGTLAAATAGAVASPAAASDDDEQGSASSNHLAQYASPTGRVNTEGLDEAFADWNSGNLSGSQLDDVIDAWNSGQRVVNKTVIDISSNISSDRTLEKNPNNPGGEAVVYRVTGEIDLNAQLTIEPGAVMEFQQGTRLTIRGGTLVAEGTAQEPIFVSATNATRGWWDGFHFRTENLDNVMKYVTMEYGGGDRNGNVDLGGGFGNAGTLTMSNCTLRRSGEYGVSLAADGELLDGSGENTYRYNRSGAAEARTSNVHTLSGDSSYTGNDYDFAFVNGAGASGDGPDSEQRTWDALDAPYRMDGEHTVNELTLDIQPGATFEFTQQSRLTFNGNARMLLEGTANEPITFTGSDDQRGWWDGIYALTTDIDNVMSHVTVEYGANGLDGNLEFGTGFGENAEIAIDNCTFRQADGYGLYIGGSSVMKAAADNTYTGNASGAARIRTNQAHYLSDTSSFTGNDNDWVLVSDASINGDGADAETRTWDAIEVPYRMDGTSSVNNITLVIDHGGTFEFTEASRLTFNSGSRIDIVGFDEDAGVEGTVDEITFTGTDQQRGWWDGVFVKTSDIENVMEHVVIEYGGAGLDGNLEIGTGFGNTGATDLIECTLRESSGYGLYLGNGAAVRNTSANVYTRNASGAARVKLPMVNQLSDASTFTGNDNDWVQVDGRNVNENRVDNDPITWDAIDVPYRVNGNPAVNDVEVVIDPGATFEFTESSGLDFSSSSAMTVEGTDQDPITFTGTDQQRGWWDGIYVGTESVLNTMSHTIIEYGGDDLNGNLEISTGFGSVGSLEVQNCTLRESGGYGLYLGNQGDFPNAEGNEYTANTDGPARVKTAQVHYLSDTSTFTGNDEDWVQVDSRNINSNRVTGPITWDALDVPYRLGSTDSTHKVSDVELIIDPGAELQFEEQSQLWFASGSVINVQGEENNRIVFTATADSRTQIAGWWDGIYVSSNSILNTMDYVTIEYGGRALGGNLDLGTGFGNNAALTLTNSIIRNSASAGVFYDPNDVSTSNWSGNTYSGNQGGDVVANN